MSLAKDQILKIISLARLSIKDANVEKLVSDFNNILAYVDTLNLVNVDDVEPLSHTNDTFNVFREDCVVQSFSTEEALSNCPDRSGSFIRVPLIVESE